MTGRPIQPSNVGGTVMPSQGAVLQTTVLVVDDSAVERCWAGDLVQQSLGWKVVYAEDGKEGLAAIRREVCNLFQCQDVPDFAQWHLLLLLLYHLVVSIQSVSLASVGSKTSTYRPTG